ncbi:hypothetical protein [Crenothrix sp.]|uniref:hypothetical protein n=1 Tax=Crenothrix sp. TaxID=3100433 RepID=UPI00374D8013
MKPTDDNPAASHDAIFMLLPWYVNKTLQSTELTRVERHLNTCLVCKRELISLQRLAVAVNHPYVSNGNSQASFARLKTRLHATAEHPPTAPVATIIRPAQWHNKVKVGFSNSTQSALAVAAVILLAVLLPRLFLTDPLRHEGYQTLSDSKTIHSNSNEIKVIFKNNTSQQTIEQIVASVQGYIISGPDAQSLYTLGFEKNVDAAHVMDKLPQLKSHADIVFAEPAYGLLSKTQAKGEKP